ASAEERNTSNGGQQYFFDMSEEVEDHVDRGGRRRRKCDDEGPSARQARVQQPCWFCLSNVDVEKYLVVSVGSHCYAAMPKGPLTDGHLMILPIGHIQSLVAAPQEVRDDVQRYKEAFTLMFDKQDKVAVVFERNYKTQHLQIQIVPVPKRCSKALRSSFINAAQLKNIEMVSMGADQEIWDMVNEGSPYFYVELPEVLEWP
uniref:Cwf19-like protein C-terminal domain-containing protein n=2 Tax=Parascaris univalens TaxID=6257 RepID=A0A915B4J0_PARUN